MPHKSKSRKIMPYIAKTVSIKWAKCLRCRKCHNLALILWWQIQQVNHNNQRIIQWMKMPKWYNLRICCSMSSKAKIYKTYYFGNLIIITLLMIGWNVLNSWVFSFRCLGIKQTIKQNHFGFNRWEQEIGNVSPDLLLSRIGSLFRMARYCSFPNILNQLVQSRAITQKRASIKYNPLIQIGECIKALFSYNQCT